MIRFDKEEIVDLEGNTQIRLAVGAGNHVSMIQMTVPVGEEVDDVINKERMGMILYQLANHLTDDSFQKSLDSGHEVIMKLLEENNELKDALKL
jgi:hypothetical protein